MNKKNKVLIVGKSGTGKSTIVNRLVEMGYKQVESYTTRKPRTEDETGKTFVTKEEFDEIADQMIAYTNFNGYEYGATKDQLENSDIYIIDPLGVEYILNNYERENLTIVLVQAERKERIARMERSRGTRSAEDRIRHDDKAFKSIENIEIDIIINNNDEKDLRRNVDLISWLL